MTSTNPREKIRTWDEAIAWRRGLQGTVVFTNGVFDLLHTGHVDLLLAARALGDVLIVGMNSDESVRRLKGPTRPLRSALDRAYVLAALMAVDGVIIFEQDTPLELVRALEPDVLVKGGDYRESTIVGAEDVRRRGGRVVIVPLTLGHSTTSTVNRMQGVRPDAP